MSLPASAFFNVIPGVLGVAGAALTLSGLIMTTSNAVPIGSVSQFPDQPSVAAFFGPASVEASLATVYFNGFDNSTAKPGNILFAQYPTAPVAAYTRGGSVASMTLAQLQAIPAGTITVTVDGVVKTSTSINLSTATSPTNAATLIQAGFTGGGAPVVTYDSQRTAYLITSPTTGVTSTMSFASGALATALNLTQATGSVTSQGAVAATPAAAMTTAVSQAANWASFMTTFEPLIADKLAFGTWTNGQQDRFAYMEWDTDVGAIQAGNTTSYGAQAKALGLSGSVCHTADASVAAAKGYTMTDMTRPLAAFGMGYMAALNFAATNGRVTYAYRSQGGLITGVTDLAVYNALKANGYNCYADVATSSTKFSFLQPGQVSGRFAWLDSFAGEINLNASLQQAGLNFIANFGSVPYNAAGYTALETALQDPINAAIAFGSIRQGVTLSASQILAVNAAVGSNVAPVLQTRGWYLSVKDPGAVVRAQRGSPICVFYYTDGGSIQAINLSSILIQ